MITQTKPKKASFFLVYFLVENPVPGTALLFYQPSTSWLVQHASGKATKSIIFFFSRNSSTTIEMNIVFIRIVQNKSCEVELN